MSTAGKSFIEVQFPVSKVSKESYKERLAGASQTLTGFGKWWGRKPLVLVRTTLLGLLMPASEDLERDREIFLKILSMDNQGIYERKIKNLSAEAIYDNVSNVHKEQYFEIKKGKPKFIAGIDPDDKKALEKEVFNTFSYDEKLNYCVRPEHHILDNKQTWKEINAHLNTEASSLQELIQQLGIKRFGNIPRVGDCFSGGGSIPFEAARMGADVYASDLNPVASFLTWAAINLTKTSAETREQILVNRDKVLNEVLSIVEKWGIEKNSEDHEANSYIYCKESKCPKCGYMVPLSASWKISGSMKTYALLKENDQKRFDIEIVSNCTPEQIQLSTKQITIADHKMHCLKCKTETPISALRNDRKDSEGNTIYSLRRWGKHEFTPQPDDVFQERLYAIRYDRFYFDVNGKEKKERYYTAPNEEDLEREEKVMKLLSERFNQWQGKGYIPSTRIEEGVETTRLLRERGWQYWHQLFNPRQLLVLGLINQCIDKIDDKLITTSLAVSLNKFADWNSKLSIWNSGAGAEKVQNTFTNQALNTLYNYGTRACNTLKTGTIWHYSIPSGESMGTTIVQTADARSFKNTNNIYITDPPYADAVNYHELTEFFLAWDENLIKKAFPEWYTDSKRALAVKGTGQSFNESMIDIYKNLVENMTDDGYQVVMFTHQDVKVWSELSMILWSTGLRVVSAWNVATETESGGLKDGNYVKGTVLLTLKKQTSTKMAFQDDLFDEIKDEVQNIIKIMKTLDKKDDPDFNDGDYLLAAYGASLKVLTKYKKIEGVDVAYELFQPRDNNRQNPIEKLINKAVEVAYDSLIPDGLSKDCWRVLKPEERFFLRGVEVESRGIYQVGVYQELARGFGVHNYKDLFENLKANSARLKTPSEFRTAFLNNEGFSNTLTRHLLMALYETVRSESTVSGLSYLKNAFPDKNTYWDKKPLMQEILAFLSELSFVSHMEHWHKHAQAAKVLKEALKNEGV